MLLSVQKSFNEKIHLKWKRIRCIAATEKHIYDKYALKIAQNSKRKRKQQTNKVKYS